MEITNAMETIQTQKEVYHSKRNRIKFTINYEDWERIKAYITHCDKELSIYGVIKNVRIKDKHMIRHSIHLEKLLPLPVQYNTSVTTEVEANDLDKFFMEHVPKEDHTRIGFWCH